MHATTDGGFLASDEREPALGGLIRAHGEDLVRLAYCLVGDRAVAEDVVEKAFLALKAQWGRRHAEDSGLAYLRSEVIGHCRAVSVPHVVPRSAYPGGVADGVRALPVRAREVLVGRYYLGLTERETAQLLDVGVGAVRRREREGLTALETIDGWEAHGRRLADALHADADLVALREQDLDLLERDVRERGHLQPPSRSRRAWQWLVAACAIGGLLLGGLALRDERQGEGGQPLTANDLVGLWRLDYSAGWLWTFTSDGRMAQGNTADRLMDRNRSGGTFEVLDDGVVLLRTFACETTWRVHVSGEGRMTGAVQAGGAGCPLRPGQPVRLTRVSPASAAGASIASRFGASSPVPVTRAAQLRGTWLLRGSGTVLTVLPSSDAVEQWPTMSTNAVYEVDDDGDAFWAPDEAGVLTVIPDGSVVFTSVDGPHSGCETMYSDVVERLATFDAHLAPTSCGRLGGLADTWVRLN